MTIMISRFAKSLVFVILAMVRVVLLLVSSYFLSVLAQLALTMVALMHPPSRAYIDPWTGQFFGEGGVERTFNSDANQNLPITDGGKGHVIMGKLGNATAKCVSSL